MLVKLDTDTQELMMIVHQVHQAAVAAAVIAAAHQIMFITENMLFKEIIKLPQPLLQLETHKLLNQVQASLYTLVPFYLF